MSNNMLLKFCLGVFILYGGVSYSQTDILKKMTVTGPVDTTTYISYPKKAMLRVESDIPNLQFESSMARELAVYKHGESAYNVHLPPERQYITIIASGYKNVTIFHNFEENKTYWIEIEAMLLAPPDDDPEDPPSNTVTEITQTKTVTASRWGKHRTYSLIGAGTFATLAIIFRASANSSYDSYQSATNPEDAQKFRNETESKDKITTIMRISSGALLTYAIFAWTKNKRISNISNNFSLGVGKRNDALIFTLNLR